MRDLNREKTAVAEPGGNYDETGFAAPVILSGYITEWIDNSLPPLPPS